MYGRRSRTTNALEAYNGVIGDRMPAKGHFFRFVLNLLKEEFIKARKFANSIRTGGASDEKKRRYSVSSMNGMMNSVLFVY